MVEKNLRRLILKQYQSAGLKSFWNWFRISGFCKDFCKNNAFCVGTFIRNFRLALMIMTLPLNKKRSSEMGFKQIIRRFWLIQRFFSFCACGICFGVEKMKQNSLCKKYSVEFWDGKFSLILRYLRVFWAYRISWIWTQVLNAGLWTLDTIADWFRTESESSFWFYLIKLMKILRVGISKDFMVKLILQ